MSIINRQGGFLIDCRECDSPDCRGCNIYRLSEAFGRGKLDWAMDSHMGIDTDCLKMALDRDQYKKGYADGAKEALDALDSVTWYNDLAETVFKWGNLKPEDSAIVVPDDYGINPHWCSDEDRPQLQVLWMIAVSLFGNYVTSPRDGWIKDIDGFRQWVLDVTKTWREWEETE